MCAESMLRIHATLCGSAGRLDMSVFQMLFAGNIGQPGAPGTAVLAVAILACQTDLDTTCSKGRVVPPVWSAGGADFGFAAACFAGRIAVGIAAVPPHAATAATTVTVKLARNIRIKSAIEVR